MKNIFQISIRIMLLILISFNTYADDELPNACDCPIGYEPTCAPMNCVAGEPDDDCCELIAVPVNGNVSYLLIGGIVLGLLAISGTRIKHFYKLPRTVLQKLSRKTGRLF